MSFIDQYMHVSQDIIGERTSEEEKYDNENIGDIEAHYNYLMNHMEIAGKSGH